MAYDATSLVALQDLKALAQRNKSELDAVAAVAASAIKSGQVSGNTVNFYTTTNRTGDPVFTFNFPKELFLDQAQTTFVPNFTFSAQDYPGATDPGTSYAGKPVIVLAVRGTTGDRETAEASDTVTYSFINVKDLVDIYTPATGETAITINGYEVTINVSADANNALTKHADGLYVDISGKVDKVTSAVAGNFATFVAGGNIQDSGLRVATTAEVSEVITEVYGAAS